MSEFGAILDWENQTLSFSSTGSTMPAFHRIHDSVRASGDTSPSATQAQNLSMASVNRDADAISVSLCETVDLKPLHEGLAVVYTDCPPSKDCTVVVEPRIVTENEFSHDNTLAH